ncbi:hypothetical protein C8Q70DRAFT_169419 [Cubamyces menziesii]|nr:hypothetical protein C8Q70DRAFT_169419 [Cubamyces menziesii]
MTGQNRMYIPSAFGQTVRASPKKVCIDTRSAYQQQYMATPVHADVLRYERKLMTNGPSSTSLRRLRARAIPIRTPTRTAMRCVRTDIRSRGSSISHLFLPDLHLPCLLTAAPPGRSSPVSQTPSCLYVYLNPPASPLRLSLRFDGGAEPLHVPRIRHQYGHDGSQLPCPRQIPMTCTEIPCGYRSGVDFPMPMIWSAHRIGSGYMHYMRSALWLFGFNRAPLAKACRLHPEA